jgi:ATP-dependent helicase HrpB
VLARESWARDRKIIVLEPRRLAARAAASRMAHMLGEAVGETVGFRVRFEAKVSRKTRIEVVTEGVFTRMVLDDPSLEGVAAVLFDEFHERSLDGDLGLALARDVQQGLREELRILVMSATIDAARVASLLAEAPTIESSGRAFPVETRYLGRGGSGRIGEDVADAVLRALRAEPGSVLAFLPGAAEIRRAEASIRERLTDSSVEIFPLFGALDGATQDRAIAPAPPSRRKIVLATSIAETSLTIEGVRIVIDSGFSRVPRYEPDVGLTRLETVRVSRASADQRRGRAGRTEPGVCYRLWDERQTASLPASNTPEILSSDLSSLALDLAHWGVADPAPLAFLDPPPRGALLEAKALLLALGAIDAQGRITEEGKRLRRLPLPPRLARMVIDGARAGAGTLAAEIALVVSERGLGGNDIDLAQRLETLRRDRSPRGREASAMARRWAEAANPSVERGGRLQPISGSPEIGSPGTLLALAYPDRIARNRGADAGFLLTNGRGAAIDPVSPLAREPWLAVAELAGSAGQSRILLAAALQLAEIETLFAERIERKDELSFDEKTASLRARRIRRLGALTLAAEAIPIEPNEQTARMLAEGIAQLGITSLPWTNALRQWRDRVMFMRHLEGGEWPDVSDAVLIATAGDWLSPWLDGETSLADFSGDQFGQALRNLLPPRLRHRLDLEAPTHFAAPSGSSVPIDYAEATPKFSIRVQELFGLDRHPSVGGGRVPLVVELMSPAQRPVQVTRDLPGFWRGSYAAVRTEMRGRYPRHPWPDDPLSAPATRRAKPRGK